MKKIIKSQFYQLAVDKAIFLMLLLWVGMELVSVMEILTDAEFTDKGSGLLWFVWNQSATAWIFMSMLITVLLMSKDFTDKTLNYDIMAGNSRAAVFFGRFIPALVICEAGTLVDIWSYPLCFLSRNGWGNQFAFSGAMMRSLLLMLAVYRIVCEFSLFSMVLKRKGIAYFLSLAIYFVEMLICSELYYAVEYNPFLKKIRPFFSVLMFGLFSDISDAREMSVLQEDRTILEVFDAYPKYIPLLILNSLGIGTLALLAAYHNFRKKDLE